MVAMKCPNGTLWHAVWGLGEDSTPWQMQEAVLLEVQSTSPGGIVTMHAKILLALHGSMAPQFRLGVGTFVFSSRYWKLTRMREL